MHGLGVIWKGVKNSVSLVALYLWGFQVKLGFSADNGAFLFI